MGFGFRGVWTAGFSRSRVSGVGLGSGFVWGVKLRVVQVYRAYIGIMEKKVEATILGCRVAGVGEYIRSSPHY